VNQTWLTALASNQEKSWTFIYYLNWQMSFHEKCWHSFSLYINIYLFMYLCIHICIFTLPWSCYKCLFLPQIIFFLLLLMGNPLYDENKKNWQIELSNLYMSEHDTSVFHLANWRFMIGLCEVNPFFWVRGWQACEVQCSSLLWENQVEMEVLTCSGLLFHSYWVLARSVPSQI